MRADHLDHEVHRGPRPGRAALTVRLAVVVAAILLGGCSSSPDGSAAPPSTETPATAPGGPGTTSTTRDPDADLAAARRALPRAEQLPGGAWVEAEARPAGGPAGLTCETLAERAASVDDAVRGAPRAGSGEHRDLDTGSTLSVDVTVLASLDAADVVEAAYTDERYPACLAEQLRAAGATAPDPVAAGPVVLDDVAVAASALDRPPTVGRAVAWTVAATATDGSGTEPTRAVVTVVRLGRVLVTVAVTGPVALDGGAVAALVDAVARHADSAAAG